MRLVIETESDPEMKRAYTDMLEGSLSNSINAVYIYDGKLLNKIGMRIILW